MQTARWLGIKKNLLTFLLPQQEKKFFNNESIFFPSKTKRKCNFLNWLSSCKYWVDLLRSSSEFFSLFVVDEDDHLRSPRPNYVCRSEVTNFGFELFTTTSREGGQFGSTWLQGKPRFRTNEKRVLQRDPVENLNEVILSLLHHIRI